jgi:uncharacterized protein (DUF885 family)
MRSKFRLVLGHLVACSALLTATRADEYDAQFKAIADTKGRTAEGQRLQELFKVEWAYQLSISPEFATYVGASGYDTKWTDLSAAAVAERKKLTGRPLTALATINRAELSENDRVSYDLFKRQIEEAVEGTRFPTELQQLTQLNGVHQDASQYLDVMPTATVAQLETQVTRLHALPQQVDQVIALLADGLARGITPPQVTLRDVPQQVLNQIPEDALKSPLLGGFNRPGPNVSGEEAARLKAEAVEVYAKEVKPAFTRLEKFLTESYLPGARTGIAASELPDGKAWYAWRVKTETSTDLTPQQIHEIGLSEVKRIRAEMERVKALTGFKGTLPEFFEYLRTEPKFFYTDKEDLLRGYRDIAKRIDPQLMKLFRTLPRTTYGVVPVPAFAEKSQTTAYYYPGAPEVGRPGNFFANTYALNTRPKWEMESLTLHEAVPGHHLQISIAQELGNLPEFRRNGGYTAFVEGWGLYSESLGEELGLYTDPYAKFGQLTYEMWRAIRLVVDTGMHALGWSRAQAIQFFKDNAGKTEHDIIVEVDRYIVWPGQALAYKLGELKIKELRAFATKKLGAKFDVREFHDEVLKHGAVPLSVLDSNIREWVAGRKKS